MAIINCWECENKVSSEATACPHCGAPVKKISVNNEKKQVVKGKTERINFDYSDIEQILEKIISQIKELDKKIDDYYEAINITIGGFDKRIHSRVDWLLEEIKMELVRIRY